MFDHIRRDIARYNRRRQSSLIAMISAAYSHPAFIGQLHYRASRFCLGLKNPVARLAYFLLRAIFPAIRLYSGVEIHPRCQVAAGAYFGHFGPIVLHPECRIGEQVTIMQGVSIGETRGGCPVVGNRVSIGVAASIVGPISICDNSVIAAGAVVVHDVAQNTIVVGVPARQIGTRRPEDYDEIVA